MKKYLLLSIIASILFSGTVFSQVYPNFQHGVNFNSSRKINLTLRNYTLFPGTFSFRNSTAGDTVAGYYPMAGFDSDEYLQGNLKYTPGSTTFDFRMNYRITYPQGYDKNYDPGYPLLVMLHGAAERGNCRNNNCHFGTLQWDPVKNTPQAGPNSEPSLLNNDHHLALGGKDNLEAIKKAGTLKPDDPNLDPESFPGIVLFPQNLNGWNGSEVQSAIRIVYMLLENENIDLNRVYIYGLSNGAQHVVTAMHNDPSLFAATVLMSPAATNVKFDGDTSLTQSPLWVFQGGQDTGPTPQQTETLLKYFKKEGGTPRYTYYESNAHNTWTRAFKEKDFYSWFLQYDKSDIHVYYGDTSICANNGKGVKLGVSFGMAAYQWERDGQIISDAVSPQYMANQPGSYRARFSRSSANPTESEWNKWSKPVVVKESTPEVPLITALGTPHLPDINGIDSVVLEVPYHENTVYYWSKDNQNTLSDSTNHLTVRTAGDYTTYSETLSGCPSTESDPLHITMNAPQTLTAPSNITLQVLSSSSIQLFWKDNSISETGFEIYRATSPTGPYTYLTTTDEDEIAYEDSGLKSNTTYYYKLRAISVYEVSPYTENIQGSTSNDDERPSPPTDLALAAHSINSLSLTWTPADDNTGIDQYYVYFGSDSVATGSNAPNFVLSGLAANKGFIISVKAVDYDGNISDPSNQISVSTVVSGLSYEHSTGEWNSLDEINWSIPEFTGHTGQVNINERVQNDFFNFKFDGFVFIENAGQYQFRTKSDDGSRVYIGGFDNDHMVFDNDGLHGSGYGSDTPETLDFEVGFYPITVTYFEQTGSQYLHLEYKGPDTNNAWKIIPGKVYRSGDDIVFRPPNKPTNLTASTIDLTSIQLDWQYKGDKPDEVQIVILGSSTASGVGASTSNTSWAELLDDWLKDNTEDYVLTNMAEAGFTTEDIRPNGSTPTPDISRNINAALTFNPNIIIVNLPIEDIANGTSINTIMGYYREIKAKADASGTSVYFTTSQPASMNSQAERNQLKVLADSIKSAFGKYTIDIYSELVDTNNDNNIKASYTSDGTQLNDAGHNYVYTQVSNKLNAVLTSFEVYRSNSQTGTFKYIGKSAGNILTYTDTKLAPNTTYYYKVKTANTQGVSDFSNVASATTSEDNIPPSKPTNLNVISRNYTNVGLTWAASTDNVKVIGYEIYANNTILGSSNKPAFSTNLLEPSTSYYLKVRAFDSNENYSEFSDSVFLETSAPEIFYSTASGKLDNLNNWSTEKTGSGIHPSSFAHNGQYFIITNRSTVDIDEPLEIGGKISRLIVDDNITLNINSTVTGKVSANANAIINVNNENAPDFVDLSPSSSVIYNTYTSVKNATYGNLTLNDTGIKNIPDGITVVAGDLDIADGITLKGLPGNTSSLKVSGNVTINGTMGRTSLDNQVELIMSPVDSSQVNINANIDFYSIETATGKVKLVNQSEAPVTVTLGSLNGGGLILNDDSKFDAGNNNITITGAGNINPNNENGTLAISNGDLNIASSSTSASHLRLDIDKHTIHTLTTDLASSSLYLEEQTDLTDGLKIVNGEVITNDHLTLKSTADYDAAIKTIENGSLTGQVEVERYIASRNSKIWRYIAVPVNDYTVADLQNYIPVSGSFTGSDFNSNYNPSLYYYDEPDGGWITYPSSNQDNTAPIELGKGYSIYVRSANTPTTLISKGETVQGEYHFTLNPGTTSSSDGWNLLGNPYASAIEWGNQGWTSSGVGSVVSIMKNSNSTVQQFMTWDRETGLGQLENGKIPSGQSFWVQTSTSNPSLSVSEIAKTQDEAADNTEYYRTGQKGNIYFAFSVKLKNDVYEDYTLLKFMPDGENAYNKLKDGAKRNNSLFNISTRSSDDISLAVNSLSDEFCTSIIPLNLFGNNDSKGLPSGVYHITFGNIGDFDLGTVELIDSLKEESLLVNNYTDYSFEASIDQPSTYHNRFYVRVIKDNLAINKTISAPAVVCSTDNEVLINIQNSQPGVEYKPLINGNTTDVYVLGNGKDTDIAIDKSSLSEGVNTIKISATQAGCSAANLTQALTVRYTTTPITNVENQLISACVDSNIVLTASGAGQNGSYIWRNVDNEIIEGEHASTLVTTPLNYKDFYSVTAVNAYGCESDTTIEVKIISDEVAVPTIAFDNGILSTDAETSYIQWYKNGEAINGETGNIFKPSVDATYNVEVSNGICTQISDDFEYMVTEVYEPLGDENLTLLVYPNPSPAYKSFNIQGTTKSYSDIHVELVNVMGKVLMTKNFSSESFSNGISITTKDKLSPGIYVVRINQDGLILQRKLIIE